MRSRVIRGLLALMLLATSMATFTFEREALAGLSTTGNVSFPSGNQTCTITTSADPNAASASLALRYPRVFASPAFNTNFPGQKQRVSVTGKLEIRTFGGATVKYRFLPTLTGLAGFGSNPFDPTPTNDLIADGLALGNTYSLVFFVDWYDQPGTTVEGSSSPVNERETAHIVDGTPSFASRSTGCAPIVNPQINPALNQGTVNQNVKVFLRYAFADDPGCIACNAGSRVLFNGTPVVLTQLEAKLSQDVVRFKVPALPAGTYPLKVERVDGRDAQASFTIKPRIKVIPSVEARGNTVNISLRGFGKQERVRIRWKRGAGFVTLTTVTTSNSGSANVDVTVPRFAPDGVQTVRGDGTANRAQTVAFSVAGGPLAAVEAKTPSKPSPTASPTSTPTNEATIEPTVEITAEPTIEPTLEPTSEATPEPTIEATVEPTLEPTMEPTETPTATPDVEPTVSATEEATIAAPEGTPASSSEG